ncbi:LTA synthase family protein [Pedobacter sp.]|jgi:phosphoglycerol transferase MdoB-like AlkP superfamily enzyme|uniref:LTA synthase family protein n=1 Tax=Pedobacter sp. TaxID=1411316 RepID=UPI002C5574F4|nr:sulfatase-like hydrolase/transferase [Pedobacter sp.]HWW39047.1 sulfatase-like hydrolase/transferase [Pedobacter sp.]
MLKSLIFFIRFYVFWLIFFFTDRALFLVLYHQKLGSVSIQEILATFYNAIPIDLSMAAYITIAPLLIYLFWLFKGRLTVEMKWLTMYNTILIVLFSLISVINFNIYREWGTKLNAKAIGFAFSSPNESLASGASSPLVLTFFILGMLIVTSLLLQKLLLSRKLTFIQFPLWAKTTVCILLLGINFLVIRGGWGVTTMNQSSAYFSDRIILNHAAVNTEWNLFASVIASLSAHKNKYLYYSKQQADESVRDLYHVEKDTTLKILTTTRPNVVLFIMESFTADLTKVLGNMNDVTPHFDSLTHQGVLFSNIYSTGNRTDKGIIGTLAGFPSLAAGNLVKYTSKMHKLPAISQELNKNGYSTAFYYGGESEFDNYKAFILTHGYQRLIDKNKFEDSELTSKWGAYDGVVFNRQIRDLKMVKQPFFTTTMTLTNHEPFEVPGNYKFGSTDNVQRFKSTAFYTDSCINDYLTKAKKEAWYKNTLFIFIADHGHILPKETNEVYMPQRYHVPLLLYGEVIKPEFRGKTFSRIGSQIDLASTLLTQLGMNASQFTWSKNLLNPYTKPFAFFSWDNGLGFINPKQSVTFDNTGKRVLYNDLKHQDEQTQETLKQGKTYLQKVYQQFIEL